MTQLPSPPLLSSLFPLFLNAPGTRRVHLHHQAFSPALCSVCEFLPPDSGKAPGILASDLLRSYLLSEDFPTSTPGPQFFLCCCPLVHIACWLPIFTYVSYLLCAFLITREEFFPSAISPASAAVSDTWQTLSNTRWWNKFNAWHGQQWSQEFRAQTISGSKENFSVDVKSDQGRRKNRVRGENLSKQGKKNWTHMQKTSRHIQRTVGNLIGGFVLRNKRQQERQVWGSCDRH